MGERLNKLLSVKSIVTIALTAGYLYLACCKTVPQEFQMVFTTVIAFYFGTQSEKHSGGSV